MQRRDAGIAVLLASLCVVAYAPTLTIPLSSDDYPNITQSLVFGPWSGLPALFSDAVFRLRSTSYWAMYLMWQTFHLTPIAYHVFSLLLHIANTLLVYRLAKSPAPGPRPLAPDPQSPGPQKIGFVPPPLKPQPPTPNPQLARSSLYQS